jgi:hypothetical protein
MWTTFKWLKIRSFERSYEWSDKTGEFLEKQSDQMLHYIKNEMNRARWLNLKRA